MTNYEDRSEYLRIQEIESLVHQAQRDLGKGDGSRHVHVDLGQGARMLGDWIDQSDGIVTVFSRGLGSTTTEKAPASLCRSIAVSSTDRLHTHVAPDEVKEAKHLAVLVHMLRHTYGVDVMRVLDLPDECHEYGVLENLPEWERKGVVEKSYPLALRWYADQDPAVLGSMTMSEVFHKISRAETNLKDIASGRLDFDQNASDVIKAFAGSVAGLAVTMDGYVRCIVEGDEATPEKRLADIEESRRRTISVRLLDLMLDEQIRRSYRPFMKLEDMISLVGGIIELK